MKRIVATALLLVGCQTGFQDEGGSPGSPAEDGAARTADLSRPGPGGEEPVDAEAPGAPPDLAAAGRPSRDAGAARDLALRDAAAPRDLAVARDLSQPPNACSSNSWWQGGNRGSSSMHPGLACITCHAGQNGAPRYTIAGTVYLQAHEPDDCNGVAGNGLQILITDNAGKTLTLAPNGAGNFYSQSALAFPVRVKLVSGGRTRAMAGAAGSGDCNSCHTVAGSNGAPGRIMAP